MNEIQNLASQLEELIQKELGKIERASKSEGEKLDKKIKELRILEDKYQAFESEKQALENERRFLEQEKGKLHDKQIYLDHKEEQLKKKAEQFQALLNE